MQYLKLLLVFVAIAVTTLHCTKYKKEGYVPKPGIVLTFDDNRIDNWSKYLNLLDSLGLKATFYVSGYQKLNATQKQKLKKIQARGHEIAYHTRTHPNMSTYMQKYKKTLQQMIDEEIVKGLTEMQNDGFNPTSFAFPFGAHNGLVDNALKPYFKSIRALNGSKDYAKSLTATDKNYILYGFGLDKSSNHTDDVLQKLLEYAKSNNNCAVLVAHDINTPVTLSVTKARLIAIGTLVKQLGLISYTAAQISN